MLTAYVHGMQARDAIYSMKFLPKQLLSLIKYNYILVPIPYFHSNFRLGKRKLEWKLGMGTRLHNNYYALSQGEYRQSLQCSRGGRQLYNHVNCPTPLYNTPGGILSGLQYHNMQVTPPAPYPTPGPTPTGGPPPTLCWPLKLPV